MKKLIYLIVVLLALNACQTEVEVSSFNPVNWEKRSVSLLPADSTLEHGKSYLSVYSQIYGETEQRTYDLTATISMRNISDSDTIYIHEAAYYDTKGHLKRNYFNHSIYIAPLETVEIIIDEKDQSGGTGANFIFDWSSPKNTHPPLFEGIMISTVSRGLSFTTQAVRIK